MSVYLNNEGLYNTSGRIVEHATGTHSGSRVNLGFFGATGNVYLHLKTNLGGSNDRMHKFEFNGYIYSDRNVHNSLTFYTYNGTSTPYNAVKQEWGSSGQYGINNWYYSSDDDSVVIVLHTSASYTGGFLYHQSGRSHTAFYAAVVAHTSTSSNSGAY
jgi:hypothetical protein